MLASTLTKLGQDYIAKCLANNSPLEFTTVKIGDGTLLNTEDPSLFTDIKSPRQEVSVNDIVANGNTATFTVRMDNTGVTEGYRATEIGIYVIDAGVEKLFWYTNQDIEASYLPPFDRGYTSFDKAISIITDSLDSVVLNWDGSQLWVSKQELITMQEEVITTISGGAYGLDDIKNVQDVGQKIEGRTYIDLEATDPMYKMVLCVNDTTVEYANGDFTYLSNKYNKQEIDKLNEIKTFTTSGNLNFPNGEIISYVFDAIRRGGSVTYYVVTTVLAAGSGVSTFPIIFSGIPTEFQPVGATHILLVGNYDEGFLRKIVITGSNIHIMSATYPVGSSIGGSGSSVAAN